MSATPKGRLVFANQLRGLAALSVAVSHLIGVFWLMRDFASLVTSTPVQPGDAPPIVGMVTFAWFQEGPFGVALFFLISGLVVPISLVEHSRLSFLLARALRIYPTYICALTLEFAVIYAASRYWGRPFVFDFETFVWNALLVHNLVGAPSIDLVNWSLCIELKFYVILAFIAPWVRSGRIVPLFLVALVILGGNAMLLRANFFSSSVWQGLSWEGVCIVFMLIGILFNYRLRGLASLPIFLVSIAGMIVMFLAAWETSSMVAQIPVVAVNYLYAVALFGILFAGRHYIRKVRLLDGLAAISYPLYLTHSLLGYVVMKSVMLTWGLGYLAALAVATATVVMVAIGLHITIEAATIQAGRKLSQTRRMRPDKTPEVHLASHQIG